MQDRNRENEVRGLYRQLLHLWNQRSAIEVAALFTQDGTIIGFDGSLHSGRDAIAADLGNIFSHHETSTFIGLVRTVRLLTDDTAWLLAMAGMVPRGEADINPDLNAVQTLLAIGTNNEWQIAAFQNTPAVFHGRADLREQLIRDLRQQIAAPTALA